MVLSGELNLSQTLNDNTRVPCVRGKVGHHSLDPELCLLSPAFIGINRKWFVYLFIILTAEKRMLVVSQLRAGLSPGPHLAQNLPGARSEFFTGVKGAKFPERQIPL